MTLNLDEQYFWSNYGKYIVRDYGDEDIYDMTQTEKEFYHAFNKVSEKEQLKMKKTAFKIQKKLGIYYRDPAYGLSEETYSDLPDLLQGIDEIRRYMGYKVDKPKTKTKRPIPFSFLKPIEKEEKEETLDELVDIFSSKKLTPISPISNKVTNPLDELINSLTYKRGKPPSSLGANLIEPNKTLDQLLNMFTPSKKRKNTSDKKWSLNKVSKITPFEMVVESPLNKIKKLILNPLQTKKVKLNELRKERLSSISKNTPLNTPLKSISKSFMDIISEPPPPQTSGFKKKTNFSKNVWNKVKLNRFTEKKYWLPPRVIDITPPKSIPINKPEPVLDIVTKVLGFKKKTKFSPNLWTRVPYTIPKTKWIPKFQVEEAMDVDKKRTPILNILASSKKFVPLVNPITAPNFYLPKFSDILNIPVSIKKFVPLVNPITTPNFYLPKFTKPIINVPMPTKNSVSLDNKPIPSIKFPTSPISLINVPKVNSLFNVTDNEIKFSPAHIKSKMTCKKKRTCAKRASLYGTVTKSGHITLKPYGKKRHCKKTGHMKCVCPKKRRTRQRSAGSRKRGQRPYGVEGPLLPSGLF